MKTKLEKLNLAAKNIGSDTFDRFYSIQSNGYSVNLRGRYSSSIISDINSRFALKETDWAVDIVNGFVTAKIPEGLSSKVTEDQVKIEITLT